MKTVAKKKAVNHLAGIALQLQLLARSVDQDNEPLEVLSQVAQIRIALEAFGSTMLSGHVDECLRALEGETDGSTRSQRVLELQELLGAFIR